MFEYFLTATTTSLKYVSLATLTLQNAVFILMMRYVRTREGNMFMSTTAVIMSEVLKCAACLPIILFQEGSLMGWLRHLNENILQQPMDCLKISVPSILYTLQNNLLFVAVSNLDAAVFQVSYYYCSPLTALRSPFLPSCTHCRTISSLSLFLI